MIVYEISSNRKTLQFMSMTIVESDTMHIRNRFVTQAVGLEEYGDNSIFPLCAYTENCDEWEHDYPSISLAYKDLIIVCV